MGEKRYMYITPDDYEKAAEIGISRTTLERRVRHLGWDVDRAVKTAVRQCQKSEWPKWKEKAVVSNDIFINRVKDGWSEEVAALTPVLTREEACERAKAAQVKKASISPELVAIAESNGIRKSTAFARVTVYGWSVEDAISIPTGKKKKRGA